MDPDEITPPNLKQKLEDHNRETAVGLIRNKLDALYQNEPDAKEEASEVRDLPKTKLSKHQQFMKNLTDSGKHAHEIQTAWHEYYQNLSEIEKHEVWKEFYDEQASKKSKEKLERQEKERAELEAAQAKLDENRQKSVHHAQSRTAKKKIDLRSKNKKAGTLSTNEQLNRTRPSNLHKIRQNHHFKSLLFGVSMGITVLFILLFSFFNERFITPFIRPSGNVSATPIIVDPSNTGPVGPESKIIIPKINIEAPVVYDVKTVEEDDIQAGLEEGVVHYPSTPEPGETGNSVIFGHSSGNILNRGSYKFAFLLLKSLEKGDTFIIQKDGKRYVYKVYNEFVTSPDDFSVLDPTERPATMTLITCDPPGTSTNRLIIQAEQIYPDPSSNKKTDTKKVVQPEQLPSNSPSLWSRLVNWF